MAEDLDTSQIKEWRSIVTLIVFLLTSKSSSYQYSVMRPCQLEFRYRGSLSVQGPDIRTADILQCHTKRAERLSHNT